MICLKIRVFTKAVKYILEVYYSASRVNLIDITVRCQLRVRSYWKISQSKARHCFFRN